MKEHATDAEFVERLRRIQLSRRRVGMVLLTVGVLFLLVGAGFLLHLGPKVVTVVGVFRDQERHSPADFDYTVTLVLGGILGLMAGIALVISTYTIASGVLYRRRDRTADLLLECWDELASKRAAANSPDPDFT